MKTRKKKKKHIKRSIGLKPRIQWGSKWVTVSLKIPLKHLAKRLNG